MNIYLSARYNISRHAVRFRLTAILGGLLAYASQAGVISISSARRRRLLGCRQGVQHDMLGRLFS